MIPSAFAEVILYVPDPTVGSGTFPITGKSRRIIMTTLPLSDLLWVDNNMLNNIVNNLEYRIKDCKAECRRIEYRLNKRLYHPSERDFLWKELGELKGEIDYDLWSLDRFRITLRRRAAAFGPQRKG